MNINAGHQIDPRSLKEVLLAVSNWDVSAREWSQCRWWGGRQYFSQGSFPQKSSHKDVFKKYCRGGFPKKIAQKSFQKKILTNMFSKTFLTTIFSNIYFSLRCFQKNLKRNFSTNTSHKDVFKIYFSQGCFPKNIYHKVVFQTKNLKIR